MILLAITIVACLVGRITCVIQYRKILIIIILLFLCLLANLDEDTNCPLNVNHECKSCAEDQNRYGCYCELDTGDAIVTANIFTPCPAGKSNKSNRKIYLMNIYI
jgi:hypothetical protein